MRPVVVALVTVLGLTLGVASATPLGQPDDVVLDAVAVPVDLCTGTATLLDSSLLPVTLPTGPLTVVDWVDISALEGDCTGTQPTLVLLGVTLTDPSPRVLEVVPIGGPLSGTADVQVPSTGSPDLTVAIVTEVRILFPAAP